MDKNIKLNESNSFSDNENENDNVEKYRENYEKQGKDFRFNASSVFLTYPQCPESIHTCMDFLKTKGVKCMVVSKEKHKDGNPHLHAYVEFKKKQDTRNVRFFDLNGHHPYITRPISKYYVLLYVTKKKDFEEYNIDVQKFLDEEGSKIKKEKKGKVKKMLTKIVKDQIKIEDAVIEEPMLLINYDRIKKNYLMWKADLKKKEMDEKRLTKYIFKKKKRHFWIYGESNTGKTSFIDDYLKIAFPGDTYNIPKNNDWISYAGETILYCDEFKGHLTIQDLNQICDGGTKENPLQLNIKGSSAFLYIKPIVFIFSNYPIETVYHNIKDENIYNTIRNRFNVIYFDGYWKFKLEDCQDYEDIQIEYKLEHDEPYVPKDYDIEYYEPLSI